MNHSIVLRTQRLRNRIGTNTRVGLWVVPHLLVLAALLYLAFASGAMEYAGSTLCVGTIALLMLLGLGVGWARIAAGIKPKQETGASEQPSP